ncbi:MAG: HAMP domain-containing histidine kinase [Deltaproteobacteria bacterium]|nr:HAMP domain-containing histidine kinase [Deltaproteobacteria bacterium]
MPNGALSRPGAFRRRVARQLTLIVLGFVALGALSGVLIAAMGRRVRHITAETAPDLSNLSSLAATDLDVSLAVSSPRPVADPGRRERLLRDAARLEALSAELASSEHPNAVAAQRSVASAIRTWLSAGPEQEAALRESLRSALGAASQPTEEALAAEVSQAVQDDRAARQTLAWLAVGCVLSVALAALAASRLLNTLLEALEEFERTQMLRRAEAESRAAELDRFASTVAHDLRGPLTSVSLALQLAARELRTPRLRAAVETGQRTIRRLDEMIQELLCFARSGGQPDPGAHANVAEVLAQLDQELQPRAEAQHAHLHVKRADPMEVAMGPSALRSVIANLVENAIKYLGASPTREVEVDAAATPDAVEIHVVDTGQGIPPDKLEEIFRPFRRATQAGSGFGLGLATVKRLVEAYGGRVRVESEVDKGSVFTVLLPRAHG